VSFLRGLKSFNFFGYIILFAHYFKMNDINYANIQKNNKKSIDLLKLDYFLISVELTNSKNSSHDLPFLDIFRYIFIKSLRIKQSFIGW
jgi:hypothetical protein